MAPTVTAAPPTPGTAPIKRLALFTSRPTVINAAFFSAMKRGFSQLGVEVEGGPLALSDRAMLTFCREFRPDAVMELNRTRHHLPSLPREIPHIAWICDPVNHHGNRFHGSEILYGMGHHWFPDPPARYGARVVGWLPPGYCPESYFFEEREEESDFSFVGQLSPPWTEAELNRPMSPKGGKSPTFGEILNAFHSCQSELCHPDHYLDVLEVPFAQLEELLLARGLRMEDLDQSLVYDLTIRMARMHNRSRLMDQVMAHSASIRFYGSEGWARWPRYAPCHGGYLERPEQLRQVYQTTRINLHEGVFLHFRLLDCMASGGFLFYRERRWKPDPEMGPPIFQPGVHYVSFNDGNLRDKTRYYLDHPEERRRIAGEAAREVARHHTWRSRAQRILQDLDRLAAC